MDRKKINTFIILLSVSLNLTLINYIWITNNLSNIPPPWDTAWYIYMSLNDYDALQSGGFSLLMKTSMEQDPYHAPLFLLTGIISFIMFGPDINTAYLVNGIYLFVLISSVFFITKRLAGEKAAVLSAFFIATFPAVIAYSRDYYLEFPLAALTALSYLFFIRSESFKSKKDSILFGIFSGLSILTKTMGMVFFVMPFFYATYVFFKDKDSRTVRKNIIFSFITAMVVISLFYLPNFQNIFWYLFHFGFGEGSKDYSHGLSNLLSIPYWTIYLKAVAWRGISAMYTIIFLASAIIYLFKKNKNLPRDYFLIWLWFIFGYLLLSLPVNKGGERYALPILAPIAIVMAVHITNISLRPLRYCIIALSALVGIIAYSYQTGSEMCRYREVSYKSIPVLLPVHTTCNIGNINGLGVPYNKAWDIMPILEYMESLNENVSEPISVLIGFDHYFLNGCTLHLYAELGRLKGTLDSNFLIQGVENKQLGEEEIKRFIEKNQFVMTKTGFQGPDFSNMNNHVITDFFKGSKPSRSFVMSDGSMVSLHSQKK